MPTPKPGMQIPETENKDQPAVTLATAPIAGQRIDHSFGVAIMFVANGKKISRREWNDERIYLHLRANIVHINFPENSNNPGDHVLKLSGADITATDWFEVE